MTAHPIVIDRGVALNPTAVCKVKSGYHKSLFADALAIAYCRNANVNSELPAATATYCRPPTE